MLTAASAAVVAAALIAGPATAQQKPAAPATVSVEELMKPGSLPDIVVGKADAPVTIIEYASMTCPHCALFHKSIYPTLKEKYVDSGQVRFIFREFPLDNLAAAGSMLARCAPADKAAGIVSKLFETQESWAFVQGNPLPGLYKAAEAEGFTKDSFDKCLADQKLLDGITAGRDRAAKDFGVRATPSFFINGARFEGRSDQIAAFDAALAPLLKK
jgi:protein-disulfide isomerase